MFMRKIVYAPLILLLLAVMSCNMDLRKKAEFMKEVTLDSIETEYQLDNIVSGWYADMYAINSDKCPAFERREDLRYLPYLYVMFNEYSIPRHILPKYSLEYALSTNRYDTILQRIYDESITRMMHRDGFDRKTDDSIYWDVKFDSGKKYSDYELIGGRSYSIDSLRIRVVAYNDRSALEKLEQFYSSGNDPAAQKELAVYYRVLLTYEGNGDLAERFYKVLKWYYDKRLQFRNGVRLVLLRAAVCDGNARAQELCDSLGFSLCDYKIDVPCK